jgi:branched-chain amino acid transport system substrate-binding protein
MLAIYQPAIQSGVMLISANAGPHEIAGEKCAPNFFSASWQNDQTPEAMGKFMDDQKMSEVYLIAPDYAAGRDMMSGFKRFFKGKVTAETYAKFGQSDYQVEISQTVTPIQKPSSPSARRHGNPVRQYAQAECARRS